MNNNILEEHLDIMAKIPDVAEKTEMLVTVEDLGIYIDEISNFLKNRLFKTKELYNDMGNRIVMVDKKEYSVYIKSIIKMKNTINKVVDKANMQKISRIPTPIILGLKVDLIKLTSRLKTGFEIIEKDLLDTLNTTDNIVSMFMTYEEYRTSTRPFKGVDKLGYNVDKLSDVLEEIIDKNSTIDRKPLIEVIPSINSLKVIIKNLLEIGHMSDPKKLNNIKKIINIISEKTNHIVEMITEDNNKTKVSKERIHELGTLLEYTAKFVTLATTYTILLNKSTEILKNSIELIEDNM